MFNNEIMEQIKTITGYKNIRIEKIDEKSICYEKENEFAIFNTDNQNVFEFYVFEIIDNKIIDYFNVPY